MRKLVFISGLPRSGSTLLAAILRQNPEFHAGMSSPVFSLVNGMMAKLSNASEFNVFFNDTARARVLRGLFESYYADQADKVVFDTNRSWTQKLPVLLELFPDARLVCCVRPIGQIVQSFETVYRRNPLQLSQIFGYDADTSVYTRADHLMFAKGIVGLALNGLKEAFYGPDSERLMLVSYENLAGRSELTLKKIYEFIDEPPIAHNFANVEFAAKDFDALLGAPGLHDVRKKVAYKRQEQTLPPDLVARYAGAPFWETDTALSKANAAMAQPV
jgi:sulfotransferase